MFLNVICEMKNNKKKDDIFKFFNYVIDLYIFFGYLYDILNIIMVSDLI